METSEQVFQELAKLWEQFDESHNGSTKKSKQVARKAIGEMKKLVTEYRKLSVNENK